MTQWSAIRRQAHRARRAAVGERAVSSDALLDTAITVAGLTLAPVSADAPLLGGARAALYPDYQIIVVNDDLPPNQKRFAIAHELGHFHVHAAGFHCAEADLQNPGDGALSLARVEVYNPRQRRESEASVFARELLLPAPLLRRRFVAGERLATLAVDLGLDARLVAAALATALLEQPEADAPVAAPACDLDPSQLEAARTLGRPALVHAGPGTGKTRALVGRIVFLLDGEHVEPAQILALTFSNRAAAEIRDRISVAVPGRAHAVMVCTFHAFCLDFLRRYAHLAGLTPDFRVLDPTDAALLLEHELARLSLDEYASLHQPGRALPALLQAIGRAKDELVSPERYAALAASMVERAQSEDARRAARRAVEAARVYAGYQQLLAERGLADFGDLIARTIAVLTEHPAVQEHLRAGYRHVLVDEYQDLNPANLALLQLLVGQGERLWAVGDPRQAIYRFRGAAAVTATQFGEVFPHAGVHALAENYRSRDPLVAVLERVAGAIDPGLPPHWHGRTDGEPGLPAVQRAVAESEQAEIDGIARMSRERRQAGCPFGEQAVLCRTHAQADTLAAGLEARGVPVAHLAHFFERPEVRDLLAALAFVGEGDAACLPRLARHPDHAIPDPDVSAILHGATRAGDTFPEALSRVDHYPGVSPAGSAAALRLWARLQPLACRDDPWDLLTHYLFGGGEHLADLARAATATDQSLRAMGQLLSLTQSRAGTTGGDSDLSPTKTFLRYVRALIAAQSMPSGLGLDATGDAVQILTVHASKGLEFDTVFVPRLATRQFPPQRRPSPVPAPSGMLSEVQSGDAEEQCLLFVAMSRARQLLVLSRAERYGSGKQRSSPSPLWSFLDTAAADLLPEPLHWSADPTSSGGQGRQTVTCVEPAVAAVNALRQPEFTARALDLYLTCPRSYYYHYVRGLPEQHDDLAYKGLHDCIRQTAAWLRGQVQTGGACEEGAMWQEFSRLWQTTCPPGHVHQALYRDAARDMLQRLWDELHDQPPGPAWRQEVTVSLDAATVRLPLDFAEMITDGLGLARYRTGRPRPEHAKDDRRLTLYREAARQAGEHVARLEIRYLSDGTRATISDNAGQSREHLSELNQAVEGIVSGVFPASRSGERCPRCRYGFTCPS